MTVPEMDMPEVDIDPWTGAELHPGDPEHCQGNGEHPDFEICCDNCNWYLACFKEEDDWSPDALWDETQKRWVKTGQ